MIRTRMKKVAGRMVNASRLHRWSGKKGAKIYKAGIVPAATFGIEATGASPSLTSTLRAAAARLSRFSGSGRCATTVISSWDPSVRIPKAVGNTWFALWNGSSPKSRALIKATWIKTFRGLQSIQRHPLVAAGPWRSLRGHRHVDRARLAPLRAARVDLPFGRQVDLHTRHGPGVSG